MQVVIDVPEWTKAITATYVYYDEGGDGRLTVGVKALAGQELEAAIREEDDGK